MRWKELAAFWGRETHLAHEDRHTLQSMQEHQKQHAAQVLDKRFVGMTSDLRALLQRLGLVAYWPRLRGDDLVEIGQLRGYLVADRAGTERRLREEATLPDWAVRRLVCSVMRPAPRILCLHGFSTSSGVLRDMLKPLLMHVPAEFVFVDGQHPREALIPDRPIVRAIQSGWPSEPQLAYAIKQQKVRDGAAERAVPHDDEGEEEEAHYHDLEGALAYLYERVAALGPFDGLCAYSQGANLGAIVAAAAAKGLIKGQPAFKFALCFCGSEWGYARQAVELEGHQELFPVATPSIIVQGCEDPLGDARQHRRYADLFHPDYRVELRHKSGHVPFDGDIEDSHQLAHACRELIEACSGDEPTPPPRAAPNLSFAGVVEQVGPMAC